MVRVVNRCMKVVSITHESEKCGDYGKWQSLAPSLVTGISNVSEKAATLSFSFLCLSRQSQQLPLWTRKAQTGSQIKKLCRGNVTSGSACRTSLGRLSLQPTNGHLCPRRWYSAASTFVWSLCSSQMACSSPHGSNRRLPRKFHFCKRHWKFPMWQQ